MSNSIHKAPGTSRELTIFIAITQGLLVSWSVGSALLESGPASAAIITYFLFALYVGHAIYTKNPLMIRLVIFGAIAGILELPTDDYLVTTIDSLVYPGNEPMIWSSPLYMPLAWANVLIQLGYYGLLLARWKGIAVASIVLAIAGGMYIPLYEHLAKDAGWWWYNLNTTMIFNAPVYVILCEALISLSLPLALHLSIDKETKWTFGIGILEGLWIFISAVIAYYLAH
ncbi:MAG: hypothetical protein AAFQ94_11165 [Bacteroidota bacterium]